MNFLFICVSYQYLLFGYHMTGAGAGEAAYGPRTWRAGTGGLPLGIRGVRSGASEASLCNHRRRRQRQIACSQVPGTTKEAMLSGCSAGGLATYLHCDAFADMVAPVPAKCVADAGYFANIPSKFGTPPAGHANPRASIIEYEYTWVFENQASPRRFSFSLSLPPFPPRPSPFQNHRRTYYNILHAPCPPHPQGVRSGSVISDCTL